MPSRRTLQPPFPNKITKPFLGTESVFSKSRLWKGPFGDYPPTAQAPLLSPARTLSPKFPESHRIIASSVWPGGLDGHMVPAPGSPLPSSPQCPSSSEAEAEAAVRINRSIDRSIAGSPVRPGNRGTVLQCCGVGQKPCPRSHSKAQRILNPCS